MADYRVDITKNDGTTEYFDTFTTRDFAEYHIALAKSSVESKYYKPIYEGAIWNITEVTV